MHLFTRSAACPSDSAARVGGTSSDIMTLRRVTPDAIYEGDAGELLAISRAIGQNPLVVVYAGTGATGWWG
jgi:hypothetical protein